MGQLKAPPTGVYEGVPDDEYKAWDAIRATTLKTVHTHSPLHAVIDSRSTKETDAMRQGTLVHAAILEPETIDDRFATFEGDRRTKAGKAAWAELAESGKSIIKPADMGMAEAVTIAAREHKIVAPMVSETRHEVTYVATYRGHAVKARLDMVGDGYFADIKTTRDVEARAFSGQFAHLAYQIQFGWYQFVAELVTGNRLDGYCMPVSKTPPFEVHQFRVADYLMEQGRRQALEAADTWIRCIESGEYPGRYADGVYPFEFPEWAIEEEEPEGATIVENI